MADAEPKLPDLSRELYELTWSETVNFSVQLRMEYSILKKIEEDKTDDVRFLSAMDAWLRSDSEASLKMVVSNTYPSSSCTDPIHNLHQTFLHTGFLYSDLRQAIHFEDGHHIVRHWKLWLPRFLGTGCENYGTEAADLIINLTARFPRHISYIATHNRTVNMSGIPGHGKPLDQVMSTTICKCGVLIG